MFDEVHGYEELTKPDTKLTLSKAEQGLQAKCLVHEPQIAMWLESW